MTDVSRGVYRHFKGGLYFVEGVVEDVTNVNQIGDEPTKMVLYHKVGTLKDMIVREITEFTASVHEDGTDCLSFDDRCDGTSQPRYVRLRGETQGEQDTLEELRHKVSMGELVFNPEVFLKGMATPEEMRKFLRLGFNGPDDD